ncbi:hypothetical protein [Streptomyces sp. NPDC057250]|uniref:hypothetical protein n=1 Tax=Streptomyces sp. NPDC057250 TaxID=3346068 RepID=UPI00362B41AB
MGACPTPTADMAPWYNVEISGGHVELTATTYLRGWYRIREAGGATDWREVADVDAYTEEERAAAWVTLGPDTFASPAAPVTALLATLDQVIDHPAYGRWKAESGQSTADVRVELREDGRVLVTGPDHRHPEDQDGAHLHSLELLFAYIAPLRDAVANLDTSTETPAARLDPPVTVTGDGSEESPFVLGLGGTEHRQEECGCECSLANGQPGRQTE